MGFWDVVYSTGDKLKGITPDLSTAKRAGGAAYNFTSVAVVKVDQAVRVDGIPKLYQYFSDEENRAQIGRFTTTLAKNTGKYVVQEGYKHIPGLILHLSLSFFRFWSLKSSYRLMISMVFLDIEHS